jgi:arylsulfatase
MNTHISPPDKTDKSPRDKFFYVSDDGQLLAIYMGDWEVVFAEQWARRFDVWRDPFVQ